jgi:ankyrin repeat protein
MATTAGGTAVTLEIALLAAVEANDVPGVSNWIKRGANVNQRGPLPYTVLMIAAGRGYVQITDLLLSAGADVHALDSTLGASALHKAAQSGVVDVARLLLDHGAFINLQSATVGHTPLIDAVWAKKPAMVKFLLERGAALTIKTHYQGTVWDFIGREPRWTAGGTTPEEEGWGRTIREMLEARQAKEEAAVGAQPLMQAVLSNNLGEVKRLIAAGADVNELSPVVGGPNDGQTPLLVASFNGFTEIVRELVAAGANPRIIDYLLKATPAHKAAFSGHPGPLQVLVDQGLVDLNAQGPYNGYTALHDSVWHGHAEAMEVLLGADVRTDLRGFDGNTALDLAVALGYEAMAAAIRAKMQTT